MPEDDKTIQSGGQEEEAKGSRKPARKPRSKPAGETAKKGTARKPRAKSDETEKGAAKPKAESKPKPKADPKPKSKPKAAPKEQAPQLPVVRASARYVRSAPRKARLVADQVRGLHIEQARALLQFSPRSAGRDILRLIDSAAANAENNHELVADDMKITEITVDEGPTLRRYRPRALGRATRINKRTSHISVALSPEEE
jgi:large subunit ribosomal protein L22